MPDEVPVRSRTVSTRQPRTFPPNPWGLTHYNTWGDLDASPPLESQLQRAGVPYDQGDIPHLLGLAGCAYLVFYTSTRTGLPVTVLCIPHRSDIDTWSVEYFYFEGMARAAALRDENWWIDHYPDFTRLRDQHPA